MTLLRVYTEYSMLTGECRLEELAERASELSYAAVAKTDVGTLAGSLEFSEYARQKGINPLIGCEITSFVKGEKVSLIIIAMNDDGISDINVFSSFAMTEKSGLVPESIFEKYSENVVAIAVGFNSIYEKHQKSEYKAERVLQKLRDDFPNFYVGLERMPWESEEKSFKLYNFCRKNFVNCVIANPVYLTKKENAEALVLLDTIKNGSVSPKTEERKECYIRTPEELKGLFSHLKYVWENTCRLGRMCKGEFETDMLHLPVFPQFDPPGILREKAFLGLEKAGLSEKEEYISRLKEELDVIEVMGFADYFLITEDFVSFAKSKGIPVGPGRGSGVGSLTAFCIGITAVDPVENGLLFQRFLNEERVSMPDFDIDFGDERREEIIRYVKDKYGRKHVCGIANYSKFAFRQCIRDVAKYLNWDATRLISFIPEKTGITTHEALKESRELYNLYKTDKTSEKAINLCKLLEGRPRAVSPHPSGVIMTKRNVSIHVPLMAIEGENGEVENISQFSMNTCAKLGLLKIDFLGIKYLTVIDKAKKLVKKSGKEIYEKEPPFHKSVYQMLSEGNSAGVFQLEGGQMKELLKKMKPQNLQDLTALISLYRPGPKIYIEAYLRGRQNPESVKYPVPQAENALKSTYGCPIYQEQIMQLCRDTAGFSLGKADVVRCAMSKKDKSLMMKEKREFVDGCEKNGIDGKTASKLFDDICGFSKYAFNKSHASAYALLSYETAYLKKIYPKEYFSAKLDSVQGQFNKICEYALEMRKLGVELAPPCVNSSEENFIPFEKGVRYSLSAIKGVGSFGERIVKERKKNGIFKSADDFISRIGSSMGAFALTALAKSGAFDVFGEKRSVLVKLCEENSSSGAGAFVSENQMTLSFDNEESIKYKRQNLEEYSDTELRLFEKEYTGVEFYNHFSNASKKQGSEKEESSENYENSKNSEIKEKEESSETHVLYIKITDNNKNSLKKVLEMFSEDESGSIVRIYDLETNKVAQLKDKFFISSHCKIEELEKILGKENVKLKALERKNK